MAVSIVQSVFDRGNSSKTLTFGSTPNANNNILAICMGNQNASISPFLPVIEADSGIYGSQSTTTWFGQANSSVSSYTFSPIGDYSNFAIFEISGSANSVFFNSCRDPFGRYFDAFGTGATTDGSGNLVTTNILENPDISNGLSLIGFEWDNTSGLASLPSGWTRLSPTSWESGGSPGNHMGSILQIPTSNSGSYTIATSSTPDRPVQLQIRLLANNFIVPTQSNTTFSGYYSSHYGVTPTVKNFGNTTCTIVNYIQEVATDRTMTCNSYFEIIPSYFNSISSIGIINGNRTLWTNTFLGSDTNGIGYKSTGDVLYNNSTITTLLPYYQGNTICVSVDIDNNLIYFKRDNGYWNNNSSANPSTQTGGIDITGLTTNKNFKPCVSSDASYTVSRIQTFTGNFSSNNFRYTPPSGFISIDIANNTPSLKTTKNTANNEIGVKVVTMANTTLGICPWNLAGANGVSGKGIYSNSFYAAGGGAGGVPGTTFITGVLQKNGVNSSDVIRIYNRSDGQFLGETTAAANGRFRINGYNKSNVYIVSIDTANSLYNGIILDNLTPQ